MRNFFRPPARTMSSNALFVSRLNWDRVPLLSFGPYRSRAANEARIVSST